MRNTRLKMIRRAAVAALLWVLPAAVLASGTVQHLSGTLTARKADGTTRILAQKSDVKEGDMLTTEKDSYAQVNFADGSQMTLRPNTTVSVEAFRFKQEAPQQDSAFFRLVKGGLRTLTGLVGKRGNLDAYKINTATATIGIRGSSGDTLHCPPPEGCPGTTPTSDKLPHGLYHTTYTGSYVLINDAGEMVIGEGKFGFAADKKTQPVQLETDPGMSLQQLPFVLNIFEGGRFKQGDRPECVVR